MANPKLSEASTIVKVVAGVAVAVVAAAASVVTASIVHDVRGSNKDWFPAD